MPLVAAVLTFGSFGDILEAARIAKRMIDVLRKGGGSPGRLKLISTLEAICKDLSSLMMLPSDHFTTRLRDELALCRSLLDQFYAKIKSYEGPLGWIRMAALEENELASWRAQISERREALRDLFSPIIIMQLHDVGCRIDEVKTYVHDECGTLGVLIETFLSAEVSRMGSEICRVGTDVQAVQQAIHKISPHSDLSDPHFYVRNPLGQPIPILLAQYRIFNDLDLILRAYCNRPDVGSRYVERGDYSIVSSDGVIIPRLRLGGELKAGIVFDISIIKRKRMYPVAWDCPHCGYDNEDAVECSWVNCSNIACGARYQVSSIEEISSLQISRQGLSEASPQEDQAESFRLVQIFYTPPVFPRPYTPPRKPKMKTHHMKDMKRNEAEQLVASVNPEAEINRAVQFVPQIYEVSDEEVPTDRDDNSSRKEV